jgi:hypothetical protein
MEHLAKNHPSGHDNEEDSLGVYVTIEVLPCSHVLIALTSAEDFSTSSFMTAFSGSPTSVPRMALWIVVLTGG